MESKTNKDKSGKKGDDGITRLEAIKKTGRFATITAASMFVILTPKKAQASSPPGVGW